MPTRIADIEISQDRERTMKWNRSYVLALTVLTVIVTADEAPAQKRYDAGV
jgi:hypothetical protein